MVFGTNAKTVSPKNLGFMGKSAKMESTLSTRISAIMAYKIVAPSNMIVDFDLDQLGASWPPPWSSSGLAGNGVVGFGVWVGVLMLTTLFDLK